MPHASQCQFVRQACLIDRFKQTRAEFPMYGDGGADDFVDDWIGSDEHVDRLVQTLRPCLLRIVPAAVVVTPELIAEVSIPSVR